MTAVRAANAPLGTAIFTSSGQAARIFQRGTAV
jgi:hypothetical protein